MSTSSSPNSPSASNTLFLELLFKNLGGILLPDISSDMNPDTPRRAVFGTTMRGAKTMVVTDVNTKSREVTLQTSDYVELRWREELDLLRRHQDREKRKAAMDAAVRAVQPKVFLRALNPSLSTAFEDQVPVDAKVRLKFIPSAGNIFPTALWRADKFSEASMGSTSFIITHKFWLNEPIWGEFHTDDFSSFCLAKAPLKDVWDTRLIGREFYVRNFKRITSSTPWEQYDVVLREVVRS